MQYNYIIYHVMQKQLEALALLRIPNLQPNPRIFPKSAQIRICKFFFAAVSDGFGTSVR